MTNKILPLKVPLTMDGVKLDRFLLRNFPSLPKSVFFRFCRSGEIRVNAKRVKGTERLKANDEVRIPPTIMKFAKIAEVAPKSETGENFDMSDLEELRQSIIYNDDDLVAFNKPVGLAVQGGTGIKKSLDKMASALFPNDTILPVHRLDRETSGVIILAKNLSAAQNLGNQLKDKSAGKEYIAILSGEVKKPKGAIESMVAKDGRDPKLAITEFSVLGSIPSKMTCVRFVPKTGRTHQLRIHSAKDLKCPIFGDDIYGHKKDAEKYAFGKMPCSLHLFAEKLSFIHPSTGENISISAEMPQHIKIPFDEITGCKK